MRKDVCKHLGYCLVSKLSGRDCADYDDCQTHKFYERFGLEYQFNIIEDLSRGVDSELEFLGIGAPMVDVTQFQKLYKV